MVFTKLIKVDLIPKNGLKYLVVGNHEIMVFNFRNNFYCYDARCTHAGAPLFDGEIKDKFIVCPWHDSRFSIIDGSVVDGPATESLRAYSVKIKDDFLYVDIDDF
ncbi:MAG: Rieske (2Fe-2S) protein [Candidatus Bathyarchaeota archaeon]